MKNQVPAMVLASRLLHTSAIRRDIDQAAKYIGAGAATVGVAGSGLLASFFLNNSKYFKFSKIDNIVSKVLALAVCSEAWL